jgi:hypothetical protein
MDCAYAARMLVAEASATFLGRQVFWLTADNGFRAAFPQRILGEPFAVASQLGGLADYSGGPATDLHRFPFCSQLPHEGCGETCRDYWKIVSESEREVQVVG